MRLQRIAENFAVSPQVSADEVADVGAAGFRVVVCNRPDGEEVGQPSASDIAVACAAIGLSFHHLPFQGADLAPELIDAFREVVENADGPVLAYCRSGQRSAYLWQNTMTAER